MSSSSSEPDTSDQGGRTHASEITGVRDLLGRSLDAIRQGVPAQYASLCKAMGPISVQLELDHERFAVRSDTGVLRFTPPEPAAAVKLTTSSATIVSLVDGRLDLLDAILDEAIEVVGRVDHLARFDEALLAYLHGAVRSPCTQAILDDFRVLCKHRSAARD